MQSYKEKADILKHIFISWVLFSTLYWIAAYYKPFEVDEFYSWVYAERCTFREILQLKQSGIGHPPLYHIIQKLVQISLPGYHPVYVRLANYFIGSLFVIIFVSVFLKDKNIPYFCYGACASAIILEIFGYSRMWGLVCLSSLLLLWSGEKYCEKPEPKYLALFLGSCVLGFVSDYSFILLSPYIVIVLFFRKSYVKNLLSAGLFLLILAWFLSTYREVKLSDAGLATLFYHLFRDSTLIILKTGNVLFNFWCVETFLIALSIFLVLVFWEIVRRNNLTRATPFVGLAVIFPLLRKKLMQIFDIGCDYNRVIITITGAWLIILTVSPLFWTNLIRKRFLTILFPYLLFIVYRNLNKKGIYVIAIILAISGLIYISSNRMAGTYPPQSFDEDIPVLFVTEWAYATQYLRKKPSRVPFILDFSSFERYCKLCKMGTNDIPFHKYDILWVVGRDYHDAGKFIPSDFTMTRKRYSNLTWLDKLLFKYLTPFPKIRYKILEYRRSSQTYLKFTSTLNQG